MVVFIPQDGTYIVIYASAIAYCSTFLHADIFSSQPTYIFCYWESRYSFHSVVPGLPTVFVKAQLAQALGGFNISLQIVIAVGASITSPAWLLHQIR